jgi:hypothetical protein
VFYIRFVLKPTGTMIGLKFARAFAEQISIPAMACFYACLVLLLMQSEAWRAWLRPFGAVGRMALTNYLVQSLFFPWCYRLTHTFGKVGPAMGLIPTFLFFAAQILISVWWLERHQFGPAEWALAIAHLRKMAIDAQTFAILMPHPWLIPLPGPDKHSYPIDAWSAKCFSHVSLIRVGHQVVPEKRAYDWRKTCKTFSLGSPLFVRGCEPS